MSIHFETLWEQCEQFHQESIKDSEVSVMIDEIIMKLKLYQLIDSQKEVPDEERQNIKSRTLGEILWTLTRLSLKDNINVFEALNTAHKFHNIGFYNQKYET
jgi:hypothetical protein